MAAKLGLNQAVSDANMAMLIPMAMLITVAVGSAANWNTHGEFTTFRAI